MNSFESDLFATKARRHKGAQRINIFFLGDYLSLGVLVAYSPFVISDFQPEYAHPPSVFYFSNI